MNQIIQSYLDAHIKEYEIESYDQSTAFEHFINKCIINRLSTERFDPIDVMTDDGEIGLDGVAILLNGQLVTDLASCHVIYENNRSVDVKIVFIQTKTSASFDGGEISTFLKGVKHFFETNDVRPKTNPKMENLISIKDYIYAQSINQPQKPSLEMYYVCCGRWSDENNLSNNIATDVRFFESTRDFSTVNFYPFDIDKIIITYTEMRRKIRKTFLMEKRLPFYQMPGIKVAYFGLIKCKDIVRLLTDDQYDMDATINKNRVVTLAGQTFAYIAMFLNEPHSINRYYGELIETYKKRIYGKDDMVEPYYIAAYYYYYVDLAIKKNQIDRSFKQFKYHLCLGLRILICGSKIFRGNSREIQKAAEKLNALLRNPKNLSRALNTVCTCLENTIKASPDIPKDIIFRSRDFTNKFIDEIKKYSEVKEITEHLSVGQIVSCQVTAIRPYTIEVELRTDDKRKEGSIHISQIADRFIRNISDEVQLGEILQAKIINDYNTKVAGWDLSLMLDS